MNLCRFLPVFKLRFYTCFQFSERTPNSLAMLCCVAFEATMHNSLRSLASLDRKPDCVTTNCVPNSHRELTKHHHHHEKKKKEKKGILNHPFYKIILNYPFYKIILNHPFYKIILNHPFYKIILNHPFFFFFFVALVTTLTFGPTGNSR